VLAKGGAVQITGQLMQGGLSFAFVAVAVSRMGCLLIQALCPLLT
jgi:hypothetical protein